MVKIVPIPKHNKDTDKGTSYRPISLLSVIAKTLEKILIPYITANIPNTPMQHGYKTQHSTVTALHTLNNTVAKGFNQMAPPARTITVALDMSKAFDIINIHTLIRKLIQTNIQCKLHQGTQSLHNIIEITHPNKVASFHPHYLTFTPQTYHHPVLRFRSWPMQTTSQSHPHTQVPCVIFTYLCFNQYYICDVSYTFILLFRRLCVNLIWEKVIYLFWVGQGCDHWGREGSLGAVFCYFLLWLGAWRQ